MFPIVLVWFVILLGVFAYKRNKAERDGQNAERAFWDKEQKANATRRQDISGLDYVDFTDLKLQYGAANLPALTQYDQNFTLLVRTLNSWGHRLDELSQYPEAIAVLSFAVKIGSDVKATYQLLAKLYQQEGESQKIQELKASAEQLNSLMKHPILTMLEQME